MYIYAVGYLRARRHNFREEPTVARKNINSLAARAEKWRSSRAIKFTTVRSVSLPLIVGEISSPSDEVKRFRPKRLCFRVYTESSTLKSAVELISLTEHFVHVARLYIYRCFETLAGKTLWHDVDKATPLTVFFTRLSLMAHTMPTENYTKPAV